MSVMRCPECEKMVDTDFVDYDFDRDMCTECAEREAENG